MRNCENGAVLEFSSDRALDDIVRLHIHCGCGFVQDQDRALAQEGTREAKELPLANTQILAARNDLCQETTVKARHERLERRVFEGTPDLIVRVRLKRIEVLADRARKDDRVLRDDRQVGTQVVKAHLGNIHVVHNNAALGGLDDAEESQGQRRLACVTKKKKKDEKKKFCTLFLLAYLRQFGRQCQLFRATGSQTSGS